MKVAIIGASGKTGLHLVREALERSHEVVAVCRDSSTDRLSEFRGRDGLTVVTAPVVSDAAMLTEALAGCDAVIAILMSVRQLRATELVAALAKAAAVNGVKRFVFTAGEITTVLEQGESFTLRQRIMVTVIPPLLWPTPFSVTDMIAASKLVHEQSGWDWTIVRAPSLRESPAVGYRFCEISDVTSAHVLSRADYAACMLDSLDEAGHHRRTLTVISASA